MMKQIPYSAEAERAILGYLLFDFQNQQKIVSRLVEDDFYITENKELFVEINKKCLEGKSSDVVSLNASKKFDPIFLIELAENVHGLNQNWISILKSCSIKRSLYSTYTEAIQSVFDDETDPIELINKIGLKHLELRSTGDTSLVLNKSKISEEVTKSILAAKNKNGVLGVPFFGIPSLDNSLNGGEKGDLIIIAARPGMGKSVLVSNMAKQSEILKKKLVIWTLEMTGVGQAQRIIANIGDLDFSKFRNGSQDIEDLSYQESVSRFNESNIILIEKSGVTVEDVRNEILRINETDQIDGFVIDYGALIVQSRHLSRKSTNDAMGHISRTMKELAKEIKAPIYMLWQLSRNVETRNVKIPMMSDLRDSGNIEQDADKIVFLYRGAYYDTPMLGDNDEPLPDDSTLFKISKNRNGEAPKNCYGVFNSKSLRFDPLGTEQRFENQDMSSFRKITDDVPF